MVGKAMGPAPPVVDAPRPEWKPKAPDSTARSHLRVARRFALEGRRDRRSSAADPDTDAPARGNDGAEKGRGAHG